MFKNLYAKLAAVLLGLFLVIGVLYILLTLYTTRLYFQEVNQKLNLILAQHLVSEKILLKNGKVDENTLQNIFHMLMVVNPVIEVYLLGPDGTILAYSAPPGKVKRHSVSLEPVRRLLSGTPALPVRGDDPRDLGQKKCSPRLLFFWTGAPLDISISSWVASNLRQQPVCFSAVIFFGSARGLGQGAWCSLCWRHFCCSTA